MYECMSVGGGGEDWLCVCFSFLTLAGAAWWPLLTLVLLPETPLLLAMVVMVWMGGVGELCLCVCV